MDDTYKVSMQEIRINISDTIAVKYISEILNPKEHNEVSNNFVREVFRYLLITKGSIHKRRREEYANAGIKPTDKFIEYSGFQGDFTGCLTHMKNMFNVKSTKAELYEGISMAKAVYHIMRLVYLNPMFINIVENEMKIKQK
jgi:hypothetical protein